jgi:IclR family transcriptional regulator, KDG regulon repressor
LQSFTLDEPERKVTDLAESLGLGKSTISRLLSTLASEGFVAKDPETQKYRLGLSILSLYAVSMSTLEVTREAQPILQKLVADIGETSHLGALEGNSVIYLSKVECKHPVQILSYVGRKNPIHCTSSGKVLLAHQKEDFIQSYIENGLEKYTVHSITDPDDLRNTLKAIKEQGYAISIEELREGVASVSAPIRDYTGKVVYAISVIGPVHRMNPYNTTIINKVKAAALEVSEKLGYWKGR